MIGLAMMIAVQAAAAPAPQGPDRLVGPATCIAAMNFAQTRRDASVDAGWQAVMTWIEPDVSLHQPAIDLETRNLEKLVADLDGRTNGIGTFTVRQNAEQCRDTMVQQLRERRARGRSREGAQ